MDKTYNTTLQHIDGAKRQAAFATRLELQGHHLLPRNCHKKDVSKQSKHLKLQELTKWFSKVLRLAALAQNISSFTKSRETCRYSSLPLQGKRLQDPQQRAAAARKHD
jgi:hypothetical protein